MTEPAFAHNVRCRRTRDNKTNKVPGRTLVVLSVRTAHPQEQIRLEARFMPAPHMGPGDG